MRKNIGIHNKGGKGCVSGYKNRKSLAFYHTLPSASQNVSGGINSAVTAGMVARVGKSVYLYNQEYGAFLKNLNLERAHLTSKVTQGLEQDASYQAARGDGVSLAWKYEKADIQMERARQTGTKQNKMKFLAKAI